MKSDLSYLIKKLCSDLPGPECRKLKSAIEGVCAKLDLVTRDEFDVQADILKRTQKRVHQLESEIEILHQQIHSNNDEK